MGLGKGCSSVFSTDHPLGWIKDGDPKLSTKVPISESRSCAGFDFGVALVVQEDGEGVKTAWVIFGWPGGEAKGDLCRMAEWGTSVAEIEPSCWMLAPGRASVCASAHYNTARIKGWEHRGFANE